jgi:hypothetical protein
MSASRVGGKSGRAPAWAHSYTTDGRRLSREKAHRDERADDPGARGAVKKKSVGA